MVMMFSEHEGLVPTMTIWPDASNDQVTLLDDKDHLTNRFEVGDCLNNTYEVRTVLGAGGMGQVFEAYDRSLKRIVAIKTSWTDRGTYALEHEAIALAAISSRHVPEVYDLRTTEEGVRYFVMERLHGDTLARYLSMRRWHESISLIGAIDILIGIANALTELHENGLVHCDLKPANVMLAPNDRIVLLDLGLFLSKGETGNDHDSGGLRGSPHYVAPERITSTVEVDGAHLIDIYSLGIIGFVLFTGQLPFDASGLERLLCQHLHEPAPRLSQLRRDAPRQLERLIGEMLAKEPSHRPGMAIEVASELAAIRRLLSDAY